MNRLLVRILREMRVIFSLAVPDPQSQGCMVRIGSSEQPGGCVETPAPYERYRQTLGAASNTTRVRQVGEHDQGASPRLDRSLFVTLCPVQVAPRCQRMTRRVPRF